MGAGRPWRARPLYRSGSSASPGATDTSNSTCTTAPIFSRSTQPLGRVHPPTSSAPTRPTSAPTTLTARAATSGATPPTTLPISTTSAAPPATPSDPAAPATDAAFANYICLSNTGAWGHSELDSITWCLWRICCAHSDGRR